jgi:hypothetical protein
MEAHSSNHRCSGKAVRFTYSERMFVALSIQHAMSMRHIILSTRLYNICPYYFINGTIFQDKKKVIAYKILILRRTQRDVTKNVCWSSRKVAVIIVRF